ncbi:hypothetical protein H6F74_23920 [Trichocoleus sp. FACHB-90]|uniref:hypothetical protein n=1 Tax=Cyanophyceae TaxID=3028117 RepID=UPI0016863B2A|nr:hypothetical protein [Trichocoleus sp. FACHB-90]MBD1929263.1 hypothetical protein [Trichocoleus sp. FACHB-90]
MGVFRFRKEREKMRSHLLSGEPRAIALASNLNMVGTADLYPFSIFWGRNSSFLWLNTC